MKRLFLMLAMIVSMASANAMNYKDARREALFLTDKMAYELGLDDAQYEAVYEINLDYLMSISGRRSYYGRHWTRRNSDLRFVLDVSQYDSYLSMAYFYRPVVWNGVSIYLNIYDRYARHRMFRGRPVAYGSYRGGFNRGRSRYEGRVFVTPPRHHSSWRDRSHRDFKRDKYDFKRDKHEFKRDKHDFKHDGHGKHGFKHHDRKRNHDRGDNRWFRRD